tara:strand:- start:3938 stop:5209 length:1272 start_codon:yes stop_codon:yes gene_type:complete
VAFNTLTSVVNAQCGGAGTSSWLVYGNSTATDECRLGTTTSFPLQIETNDTVRIQVSTYGKVGIGYNFQYSTVPGKYSILPQALLHLHSFKYNTSSGGGHNNTTNTSLSTAKGSAASTSNSLVDFLMTNDQTGNQKTDGFKIAVTGLNTYLSNQENGNIFLYTNNNPLNQMVLSRFGKVGIGINPSATSAQLNVLSTKNSGLSIKVIANAAAYGIESKVKNANTPIFTGGLLNRNNVTIYGNGQVMINSNQLPKWGSNWGVALKTPMESTWMTDSPNLDGDYYGFGLTWNGWYFIKSKTNTQGQSEYPMWLISTDNETVLRLCGTMYAKEIYVEAGWCDYVFTDTYQPMTILQKEQYYTQNKHLPNVPTAKEIEENGAGVGEALTGILQNVEENRLDITQLYKMIIELQKENKALKEQLGKLK